jgi:hypothetical protein
MFVPSRVQSHAIATGQAPTRQRSARTPRPKRAPQRRTIVMQPKSAGFHIVMQPLSQRGIFMMRRTIAPHSREFRMSDTKKTRDPVNRESRAAREAVEQGSELGHHAAEDFREVGETMADTMVRTTDAAVEIGQRVAEQSRDVMLLGVRAAAGMNGRLADAGYGGSHRALGAASRALQICQQASDNTAEHVEALFSATMTVGRGLQQMQHACLDMLDRAVDGAAHRPQDLLRCKSLEELAEVQRDLYLDAVNRAVESSTTLLQIAAQTAQQAMRPLHARANRG